MSTTIFLRFPDRETALAAFAALGLAEGASFVTPLWRDGARLDVDVLGGGTGVVTRATDAVAVDPETGLAVAVVEPRPGFHLNLLVRGGPLPDFGAAVVAPEHPETVFLDCPPTSQEPIS